MEKRFVFLTAALIIINCVSAQINKGSVFIGGDIGGSIGKTTKNGATYLEQKGIVISPTYGKAVKDNLIVGAKLLFQYTDERFPGTGNTTPEIKQTQPFYGVAVFLRKYKPIRGSSFYIFIEGGVSTLYSTFNKENSTTLEKQNSKLFIANLYAYPGIAFTVNKKLQLESGFINLLRLSYTHQKNILTSTTTTTFVSNSIGLGASLNNIAPLYVGFRVLINNKD
jgi:hypothetical protein